MTLIIDLTPELEAQLREEAADRGIDASTFVVRALEERLHRKTRQRVPFQLSQEETVLIQKINRALPEAIWQEYHDLVARRRAETLTLEEHTRLIALSDSIEETHAERMAQLAELAQRRHMSLKTLMRELGVKPRKV